MRCRSGFGFDVDGAPDGIRAVDERSRPFDDFHLPGSELIQLEAVVSPPLLAFVLDPLVHDDHPVEPESADERFGLSRTDADGMYARKPLQRFHQASAEI